MDGFGVDIGLSGADMVVLDEVEEVLVFVDKSVEMDRVLF